MLPLCILVLRKKIHSFTLRNAGMYHLSTAGETQTWRCCFLPTALQLLCVFTIWANENAQDWIKVWLFLPEIRTANTQSAQDWTSQREKQKPIPCLLCPHSYTRFQGSWLYICGRWKVP